MYEVVHLLVLSWDFGGEGDWTVERVLVRREKKAETGKAHGGGGCGSGRRGAETDRQGGTDRVRLPSVETVGGASTSITHTAPGPPSKRERENLRHDLRDLLVPPEVREKTIRGEPSGGLGVEVSVVPPVRLPGVVGPEGPPPALLVGVQGSIGSTPRLQPVPRVVRSVGRRRRLMSRSQ